MSLDPSIALPTTRLAAHPGSVAAGDYDAVAARLNRLQRTYQAQSARAAFEDVFTDLPVVVLRFDDGPVQDRDVVAPALNARHLPGVFAVIGKRIGTSGFMSAADILTLQGQGHEIVWHSQEHVNAVPDPATLYVDFINSADAVRAQNIYLQNFARVGPQGDTLTLPSDWDTPLGREMQSAYIAAMSYSLDAYKGRTIPLPVPTRWGTQPDGTAAADLASFQLAVEKAKAAQGAVIVLQHAGGFDTQAETDLLNAQLDYLAAERDAGRIRVMTASGLMTAKRGTPVNLCPDPSFETYATAPANSQWVAAGSPTVVAGTGSANAVQTSSTNQMQVNFGFGYYLRTVEVSGVAKAVTGTANARITGTVKQGSTSLYSSVHATTVDTVGKRVYGLVGLDPRGDLLQVTLGATTSAAVVWDDIRVHKA